jgi:hypothetical protein
VTVDIVVVPACIHIGIAVAEVAGLDFVPAVEAVMAVEAQAVDSADMVAVVDADPAVVVHDAAQYSAAAELAVLGLTAV